MDCSKGEAVVGQRTAAMDAEKRPNAETGTRKHILAVAEQLFADHGIDAVSLRQLGVATGQAYKSVIQYYFGTKMDLADAILMERSNDLNIKSEQLVKQAEISGSVDDVKPLIACMFLPIAEIKNQSGRYVHAGFLLQYLTNPKFKHNYAEIGWTSGPRAELAKKLGEFVPSLTPDQLACRFFMLHDIFVTALVRRDIDGGIGSDSEEDVFLDELFAVMTAAFLA